MAPVRTTVSPFSPRPSTADVAAVGIGHLQAVDHHEGFDLHFQQAPAETQHVAGMRALEEQLAVQLVVFLVEGAAGDEEADGFHSRVGSSSIAPWGPTSLLGPSAWWGRRFRLPTLDSSPRLAGGSACPTSPSALYWSHPHARYALAPAGGNSRDPRRRGLPISGTKTNAGTRHAGCARTASGGPEILRGTLALSRHGPENRPHQIRHRRRRLSAGEGRFPRESQERYPEDLRQGRQNLRPGEERRRHLQYRGKNSLLPGRCRNHARSTGPRAAGHSTNHREDFRPALRQQHRARRYRSALQFRLPKGRRQVNRRHLRSLQPRTADEARRRGPLESAGAECQAHEDRSLD